MEWIYIFFIFVIFMNERKETLTKPLINTPWDVRLKFSCFLFRLFYVISPLHNKFSLIKVLPQKGKTVKKVLSERIKYCNRQYNYTYKYKYISVLLYNVKRYNMLFSQYPIFDWYYYYIYVILIQKTVGNKFKKCLIKFL